MKGLKKGDKVMRCGYDVSSQSVCNEKNFHGKDYRFAGCPLQSIAQLLTAKFWSRTLALPFAANVDPMLLLQS